MGRAALGDWEAMKALLPYVMPKMGRGATPISDAVEIDVSSVEAAKETLKRIAAAIGEQRIGLEEGNYMMDMVGRAMERMQTVDTRELLERIEKLEAEAAKPVVGGAGRGPVSRLNGSTPTWGNIVKHPSVAD